jgi:hypothetical protein
MSLITTIQTAMLDDDEDDSERLEHLYQDANPEEKELLDNAFICLCGYSLGRLIQMTK